MNQENEPLSTYKTSGYSKVSKNSFYAKQKDRF